MLVELKPDPVILLVYKRSPLMSIKGLPERSPSIKEFKENHIKHYASLGLIEDVLREHQVLFHKRARSRSINYRPYDLVITVGGDGTFLGAARNLSKDQFILGVNSDPAWSVGQFCACDAAGFKDILSRVLGNKARYKKVRKFRLQLEGHAAVEGLNDILVCHANPAAMSRYKIRVGRAQEEQRSSGIWFSTAAGSTGAILSAGGMRMPLESRRLQYRPRELYVLKKSAYRLTGGLVPKNAGLLVTSQMPRGRVFVDGAHMNLSFSYGKKAFISLSPDYVQLIHA